jgi:hypothetical protein
MKSLFIVIVFAFFAATTIHADDISKLAQELNLQAGTKASVQWKRIFSSPRHMKKYKIDSLPDRVRNELQGYLVKHAADSDQPIVPGL